MPLAEIVGFTAPVVKLINLTAMSNGEGKYLPISSGLWHTVCM